MFERFIVNHRKLVIFLTIIIVVGLVVYIGYSATKSLNTTSGDLNTQMGDDDTQGSSLILPYTNPIYTIVQNPTKIAGVPDADNLLITAPVGYRTAAARSLYDRGFDPTNYKITFDYESPFKPYE